MVLHNSRCSPLLAVLLSIWMLFALLPVPSAAYENTHQNTGDQAVDLVSVALTQMGYMDGANGVQEYSKYGDWYGIPTGYWCAMFVSWCANQAEIPSSVLPRFASCTIGMNTFQSMGRWMDGPHWGGEAYSPQMGDLIFYNWYGRDTASHVGIVLYCEDGWVYTVEGNTIDNRLDEAEVYRDDSDSSDSGPYLPDFVMVRAHRLDSIFIRGYAIPSYSGTGSAPSPLAGYVDLPRSTVVPEEIQHVLDQEWMDPMSSHTFGPMYGVTRGEYLSALALHLGLDFYDPNTPPFYDLPPDHPAYLPIMALRSAGLITGRYDNCVDSDRYITVPEATAVLNGIYTSLEATPPNISFVGQIKDGYLLRWELAHGLCVLAQDPNIPAASTAQLDLDATSATLDTLLYQNTNYLPVEPWQQLLKTVPVEASQVPDEVGLEDAPSEELQVPEVVAPEVAPSEEPQVPEEEERPVTLDLEALSVCPWISWNGAQWYRLGDLADCSNLSVAWDNATKRITLTPAP